MVEERMQGQGSTRYVPGSVEGVALQLPPPRLGPDGRPVIETLPPLPETAGDVDLSPATGQPRRDPIMLLASGFLYASSAVVTVAFARFWWQAINITHFFNSSRLLGWTEPRPGSWQSVVWVCVIALLMLAAVAAPAIAAFQAWNGYRWSRIAGIIAVAVSGLTVLLNDLALFAIPLAAVGAALLWVPRVGEYFDRWAAFRAEDEPRPRRPERIHYGPLDRYLAH